MCNVDLVLKYFSQVIKETGHTQKCRGWNVTSLPPSIWSLCFIPQMFNDKNKCLVLAKIAQLKPSSNETFDQAEFL